MGRVVLLPSEIAERIAAGEVIERPASVVKELVENALDAGATLITVDVEAAGLGLIRVADDGDGMDAEDARLAFRRHATSKLASAEDLEAVRTLGFRGEALPSIAAVARVSLVTNLPGAAAGTRVRVEGGEVLDVGAEGAAAGTVVEVRDLFYNVPARRRFLKTPAREMALIQDAITRLALAHPQATFRVMSDGHEAATFPAADLPARVVQVMGRRVVGRLVEVEEAASTLYLRAFLGHPEVARSTRAQQFFTVNRRPVHSRMLSAAVEQAYHQLLPVGRYPLAAVFLDLPPREVDVNVHPRKLEIRFRDERRIFEMVRAVCRRLLLRTPLIRRVPAPADAVAEQGEIVPGVAAGMAPGGAAGETVSGVAAVEGDTPSVTPTGGAVPRSPAAPRAQPMGLYPEAAAVSPEVRETARPVDRDAGAATSDPSTYALDPAGAADAGAGAPDAQAGILHTGIGAPGVTAREAGALGPRVAPRRRIPQVRLMGQVQRTYLVGESAEGLALVDQHAAHERVLYERLVRLRRAAAAQVQELLLPEVLEVGPAEAALLEDARDAFAALGFEVEPFGKGTYRLRAVPAPLVARAGAQMVRECLADLLADERTRRVEDRIERLAIAAACHSAVRAGDPLTLAEMEALLRDLDECEEPYTCFHGRPTLVVIPGGQLERWFLRRL
ncbi:MAG: DNA mismatch repair endonuclease MutL [Armatimonadetes bacterium]|nr:DNA mismatch repair endonuclease MutL [Armatimonadota bacterium]